MDKNKTDYKLPAPAKVGRYTKCVQNRPDEYGDLWIADFLEEFPRQCVITFSKRKRLTLSAFRFAMVPNGDRVPIAGTDLLMGGQFEPDESGGMSTHRMKLCSAFVLDWSESTRVPYSGNEGNPFGDRGQENFRGLAKEWGEWADSVWGDRFGKPAGPLEHLRREVEELTAAPDDLLEYADVLALTMEAGRLAGFSPDDLLWAVREKLEINKAREWGPMDDSGVSSHIKNPDNGK